ncbi:GAF domain-containing protein [Nocardioides sp. KIGAM211]|uniref:GAF domain-containing protein n=1 Tax=Nocardioides luti TaxID=2761101 RepID=A0A7X0VCS0_9ACTN|nr:GAF domain-containing protein [Nocardioides luti]
MTPSSSASRARPDLAPTLAAVRALFGAAACSCALVDGEGSSLTFVAADGAGAAEIVGVDMPVGRGIAGWAAMSGQPIAVRDVASDARFNRDVAESTAYVPTSVLAAPVYDAEGEVIGVVSVLDPTVDQATDWVLTVLGTLAVPLAGLVRLGAAEARAEARLTELGRTVLAAVESYGAPERR